MGFLAGKRLLITGVLSNRSIAYGIARACKREGAELAFSYVGERFKDRITEFAADYIKRVFAMTKVECNILDRGTEFPKDINGAATEVRAQRRRAGRPAARTA